MSDDVYFYDPDEGHGLAHDPFKAIVAPRLIGWISSLDGRGQPNLAPYSFFGAFASKPAVIGFCSEGYKDSIRNIEETGEFAWNLPSHALAERMNRSSAGRCGLRWGVCSGKRLMIVLKRCRRWATSRPR